MRKRLTRHERWIQRVLRITLAVVIGSLICLFPLDFLESYSYDWRVALKPQSPVSQHVATVAVDAKTLKSLQTEPDAKAYTRLIRQMLAAEPRAIVFLQSPVDVSGSPAERAELADAMSNGSPIYSVIDELPVPGRDDLLRLPEPFNKVQVLAGPTTSDRTAFAKDSVTRRLIVGYEGAPTVHPLLSFSFNNIQPDQYRGLFDFLGTKQLYIDFHPTGTYKAMSFSEVVAGTVNKDELHDKIIIVGRDTLENAKEYIQTPYSREVVAMSVLEMHANIFDTLIQNRAPLPMPPWVRLVVTVLISALTIYVVLSIHPLQGLLTLAAAMTGFIALGYLLFALLGWWLPMAHPMLAMFLCYYFFIPYRLIMENRRSWEYYQKNKLLTQVEELKSNFLRMMSHDLKTPLARIQGMASLVLNSSSALDEQQRRAVRSIFESSEELSDFIGSILNLGRIESKEIKLQLKSKDINSLLTEVIKKCEDLGRKRGIEIRTEFEPMFSFKVDEDLIRQVFTNLLENAIKYSPENSKILVTTEEVEGQAVIQVADQGIGIPAADLPHVFDKFYRSREAKNSEVGGSGLGLYLVKYFVELHKGEVDVESEPGKGSTFIVTLPMLMDSQTRSAHQEGVHYV